MSTVAGVGAAASMPFGYVLLLLLMTFLATVMCASPAAPSPRSLHAQINARAHRIPGAKKRYAAVVDDSVLPVTVRVVAATDGPGAACTVFAVEAPVELTGVAEEDVIACQAAAERAAEFEQGTQPAATAVQPGDSSDTDLLRAEGNAARYSTGQRPS